MTRGLKKCSMGIALMGLLSLNLGMGLSGAPGDCLAEGSGWASVEDGCKDTRTGRVWSASYGTFGYGGINGT